MNIIKFSPDTYQNAHSAESFYMAVGLHELFVSGKITDVWQMKINTKTYEEIADRMKRNWRKEPKCRGLRAEYAKRRIAFDWANYSPMCDMNVPENEIWWSEERFEPACYKRNEE